MTVLTCRFQTNDKPWSDDVLMDDVEAEWRKRLKPFRGDLRLDSPDELPGPFRKRDDAITRGVHTVTTQTKPGLIVFISNAKGKGVRVRVAESENPFGPIFRTTGPCNDSYPNIVVGQNAAGQRVKLQKPALLAYQEAERLNGRPIRITGEGFRSCASQWSLYRSEPGRFANPDSSRHCRGLAIDVYNTADNLTPKAKSSLEAVGFNFAVSGEPWHCSYLESA